MSDKIFNLSTLCKSIVFAILYIIILSTKNIFLILFISVLLLILCLILPFKVKKCVNIIKNYFILLLFFLFIYIILNGNILFFKTIILIYKYLLSVLLIFIFFSLLSFNDLNNVLYFFLIPFKILKIDIEELSYNITSAFYFLYYMTCFNEYIKGIKKYRNLRKISLFKYFLSKLMFANNEVNRLKTSHIINHYKRIYNKSDLKSKITIVFFVLFFMMFVFREVIV